MTLCAVSLTTCNLMDWLQNHIWPLEKVWVQ